MFENIQISLDKLPLKRLKSIEENGAESFSMGLDYDENRISLIQRLDFAWAVDDSNKKQKKATSAESAAHPWACQNMVENLQLAHQELSVIIDVINSVEENNAVTVVGMTRPKQLPNEHLSDLAVSTATKLQCFRHLSKYLKNSTKALEQQVIREKRFYGALIRLQQNWKIKRQRQAVSLPSGEGFSIDLVSCLSPELATSRSITMVPVDKDSSGMLSLELPVNAGRSLCFGFLGGGNSSHGVKKTSKNKHIGKHSSDESNIDSSSIDKAVIHMHSVLRKIQRALFEEQVFELVKRDAVNPLHRINVIGMGENHLELSIGGQTCIFISMVPFDQKDGQDNSDGESLLFEADLPYLDASGGDEISSKSEEPVMLHLSCSIGFEIFLQQLFHQHVYQKHREESLGTFGSRLPTQTVKDGPGKLIDFCTSLAHRAFSTNVLKELENLVRKVPYLCLLSHMTWHSRVSAWTVSMKLPQSILLTNPESREDNAFQNNCRSHFRCKVVIHDDLISVEGEGGANSTGLCASISDKFPVRKYSCNLDDLSFTLLQQFAGQIVGWLHEEAVMMGMKVTRDYLRLSFEVEGGETIILVAQLDLDDPDAWISWRLIVEGDTIFLGHLSLHLLYSSVMDLVALSTTRDPILPP